MKRKYLIGYIGYRTLQPHLGEVQVHYLKTWEFQGSAHDLRIALFQARCQESGGATLPITAPNASITTKILQTLLSSSALVVLSASGTSWMNFSGSFLMLLSAGIVTSITAAVFFSLSTTTMSGSFVSNCLSVLKLNSHRILAPLFSTTFGGVSHQDLGTSDLHAAHMLLFLVCHPKQQTVYNKGEEGWSGVESQG